MVYHCLFDILTKSIFLNYISTVSVMNQNIHTAPQADEHSVFFAATQALRRHASGGNILIGATVLALIIANIPGINNFYFNFWTQEVRLQLGSFNFFSHAGHQMDLIAFINDALMAIFFFSIGLEIKREILVGELSSFKQALLPIVAAIGGMIVPVIIYLCFARAQTSPTEPPSRWQPT